MNEIKWFYGIKRFKFLEGGVGKGSEAQSSKRLFKYYVTLFLTDVIFERSLEEKGSEKIMVGEFKPMTETGAEGMIRVLGRNRRDEEFKV